MTKTGDFVADTRAGFYREERNLAYKDRALTTTWDEDFHRFLLAKGVPEKYVSKIAYAAYERGHSSGEEEILNCSYDLIEIFS